MSAKKGLSTAVLNTKQAARHVGLAPSTLEKLRVAGATGGPPWLVLLKGAVRYRVEDLDQWLSARRTGFGDACPRCGRPPA